MKSSIREFVRGFWYRILLEDFNGDFNGELDGFMFYILKREI